uniref:2OGFeDO JBP1/TET oxygenase domain-containing protein n=2 Tax=Psilocybe cubensis TaxID=181762 RepID=A0A8H8CDQ2_PSICU
MSQPIDMTRALSTYMQSYMASKVNNGMPTLIPEDMTAETLYECNLAVEIILEARSNQEQTKWNANNYIEHLSERCTGRNDAVEDNLKNLFPPIHLPMLYRCKPGTVADSEGNILAWYLPGILTERRVNSTWKMLQNIEGLIRMTPSSTSWRANKTYFRHESAWLRPGNANFSPAWFQQGHEQSNPLEVSADLTHPDGLSFIAGLMTTSALIGAILSIIHPAQFRAGIEFLERISSQPEIIHKAELLKHILTFWTSPFGVISVISNRDTPFHRDNGSCHPWYDLLMPLGNYENGRIELPGVGISTG